MRSGESRAAIPLRRKLLYTAILLTAGLAVGEVGVRIAAGFSPYVRYQLAPPWTRNRVPDPVVGYRVSPYFAGHDRNGYRNAEVPQRTDVLAIGDSMTYGFAASADGAWPQRLQGRLGGPVYNAGVGGYGPCEYGIVVRELLTLEPKTIVLALTLGNDIADAYVSVHHAGRCRDLAPSSPDATAAFAAVDRLSPLPSGPAVDPAPPDSGLKQLALFRLLRSVRYQLASWDRLPFREYMDDSYESATRRPGRLALSSPETLRTVFVDPRVLAAMVDTSDVRIQEGLRITVQRLEQLNGELRARRIRFVVVLLRDKPFVMKPVVERENPQLWATLSPLVTLEDRLSQQVSEALDARGIAYFGTGLAMQEAVREGRMLYPASDDHHPNASGYDLIADLVWRFLRDKR